MIRLPALCPRSWKEAEAQATTDDTEEALAFFRGVLGEKWTGWEHAHPLAKNFFVRFQGEAIATWLLPVLRSLSATSSTKAIAAAVKRLGSKDWAHYEGTELEFAVAGACLAKGLTVELREANAGGADLLATLEDEPIQVECKVLQQRDLDREVGDMMELLMEAAWAVKSTPIRVLLDGEPERFIESVPDAIRHLKSLASGDYVEARKFGPIDVSLQEPTHPTCPVEGPGITQFSRAPEGDLLDLMKVRQTVRSKSGQIASGSKVLARINIRVKACAKKIP